MISYVSVLNAVVFKSGGFIGVYVCGLFSVLPLYLLVQDMILDVRFEALLVLNMNSIFLRYDAVYSGRKVSTFWRNLQSLSTRFLSDYTSYYRKPEIYRMS
jgi:hypothetical protein